MGVPLPHGVFKLLIPRKLGRESESLSVAWQVGMGGVAFVGEDAENGWLKEVYIEVNPQAAQAQSVSCGDQLSRRKFKSLYGNIYDRV